MVEKKVNVSGTMLKMRVGEEVKFRVTDAAERNVRSTAAHLKRTGWGTWSVRRRGDEKETTVIRTA